MFTITNGFTYIAFLMFLAGGLLALEKYAKWKVFNVVPPLVWIYVLNMVFCTMGLYASDACSAVYSALKNNLLYARSSSCCCGVTSASWPSWAAG